MDTEKPFAQRLDEALGALVLLKADLSGELDVAHSNFLRNGDKLNLEEWERVSSIVSQITDKRNEIRDILQSEAKRRDVEEVLDLIDGK